METDAQKDSPTLWFNKVMLIDDNSIDRFIIKKIMEAAGFNGKIDNHSDGFSALEYFNNLLMQERIIEEMVPDVIFVDINMPDMNGFQFIEKFYQLPPLFSEKCRIVILTSSVSERDRNTAIDLNPNILFLNKPLLQEHLFLIS